MAAQRGDNEGERPVRDLARTVDFDLGLFGGFVTGAEATQQFAQARAETLVGDWFLNLDYGADLLGLKPAQTSQIELELRTLLRDVPGVLDIEAIDVAVDATRTLTWSATLLCEDEAATFTEVNSLPGSAAWPVGRAYVGGSIGGGR